MPEVNRLVGKHLFASVGSVEYMVCRNFALMRTFCCMYVGSWHIEISYQTPLVRTLYATYAQMLKQGGGKHYLLLICLEDLRKRERFPCKA